MIKYYKQKIHLKIIDLIMDTKQNTETPIEMQNTIGNMKPDCSKTINELKPTKDSRKIKKQSKKSKNSISSEEVDSNFLYNKLLKFVKNKTDFD